MGSRPQIVAFGGGGFSMEPGNRLLDDYVLSLPGVDRPRVCFVPTASGDAGITKSRGQAEPVEGLGLLPGSLSVHYDSEPERRPAFLSAIASGMVPEGFGADDGVGLLFRDGRLQRVVASRPSARCTRVRRLDGHAVEQPVPVEVLADPDPQLAPVDIREFRAARRARIGR
ncbi:MAG: dipeptidase [Solirubrobacteraceae bacterium]|jgi:dipeptidase E|nr:dipeptidase [Solirubrobacteraceae bacterium]